jgi:ADP-ribose pyrophosphatase
MQCDETLELIEHRVAYQGYFRIGVYRFRHSLFAGGLSPTVTREVFERGPAVGVLPYDPVRDRVALIRQVRAGALVSGQHPWLWEVIAGIVETGEAPEEVARREAMEEAGIEIGELEPMHTLLLSPGGSSEVCSNFLGRASLAGQGGIHGLAAEGEDILVRVLDWREARAMLDRGEIGSSVGTLAVQWLALHRDRIREQWRGAAGQ